MSIPIFNFLCFVPVGHEINHPRLFFPSCFVNIFNMFCLWVLLA
nr:MAG TPA: hypothetical protein [Caudoviricetes sp.]